ncbi:MAG TPA: hypothetical protein VN650_08610 [Gemmatimonadaceae bacterium]|nr:hypothetical protein [Gemmatimonadaceae bacterium]
MSGTSQWAASNNSDGAVGDTTPGDTAYQRRLTRARRALPLAPTGARELARMARNPGCDRLAVHGAARIDTAAFARAILGVDVNTHGSPLALANGVAFERVLLRDGAAPLVDLFTGAGWLLPGSASFVDVSAAHPDIDSASLARREEMTRAFLAQRLRGDPGTPNIIWHARLTLSVPALEGGTVTIEPDCLVASATSGFYTPVEVKSFHDRGPRTDPLDLEKARMQAAVEVLALRDTTLSLAAAIGQRFDDEALRQLIPDRCGLILRRFGMRARLQRLNVRRELTLMRRFLAGLRARVDRALTTRASAFTIDTLTGHESIANALREDCRSFCDFASSCEAAARRAGQPIVLGHAMEEAVGAVGTLPRLIALLEGREIVRTDDERRIVRAFRDAVVRTEREMRRVG